MTTRGVYGRATTFGVENFEVENHDEGAIMCFGMQGVLIALFVLIACFLDTSMA